MSRPRDARNPLDWIAAQLERTWERGREPSPPEPEGWECENCGHENLPSAMDCAGAKCASFREWASAQPQED